ncbi:MAG: hypothetical protein KR126chlam2_00418 [Chlamydiae bacterium]|nr:hypothetical protein [Chlamydiota bacterium]
MALESIHLDLGGVKKPLARRQGGRKSTNSTCKRISHYSRPSYSCVRSAVGSNNGMNWDSTS